MQMLAKDSLGKKVFQFQMHTIYSLVIAFVTGGSFYLFLSIYLLKRGILPSDGMELTIAMALLFLVFLLTFLLAAEIFARIPKIGYQLFHFQNGIREVTFEDTKTILFIDIVHFHFTPLKPTCSKKGLTTWKINIRTPLRAINGAISFRLGTRKHDAAKALVEACGNRVKKVSSADLAI